MKRVQGATPNKKEAISRGVGSGAGGDPNINKKQLAGV